jgi:hypothetical protein
MSDEPRPEADLLALWRWIAIGTCTILIVFTVGIDSLGRLFLNPSFHVSEILFGALISSWLILLGFEARSITDRIRKNGGDK